ncbi:response regulator transcription factor [Myroides pelagicus]|uniref:DNA-binding response regulator n=1 Tax=Myroides pelagicus TaxID=270914 RepID=A0A7K1GRB2_9FLAO|nr:response regulator transcription factor [Myroides pelagicus]MEC4114531.1 response regulator transcription factor [Myroides pelagicus]MTH30793.1 DNA-binding response regulator [Myroides pelagicus]
MLCVTIIDQQELTKYAIYSILQKRSMHPICFEVVDSTQGLKDFLQKCDSTYVFFNPQSYNFEQQINQIFLFQEQYKNCHWVMLFDELNEIWLKRMLQLKKVDFSVIFKTDSLDSIEEGIDKILSGEIYLNKEVQRILEEHQSSIYKVDQVLTPMEREVLKEIAFGKMTKEIAADRNISVHTVITHRKNIFKKLKVNNVHDATRYAIRAGIIKVNDYYI